jgi:oxygen-independent coproporphyrinogen-3 oxidase
MRAEFGKQAVAAFDGVLAELVADGLLMREGERVALTMRGRMLSNEVFGRFLGVIAQDALEVSLSTR